MTTAAGNFPFTYRGENEVLLGYEYLSLKEYSGKIHPETNIFVDIFCNSISNINGKPFSEQDTLALVSELSVKLASDDLGKAFYNILLNGINGIRLVDFENSNRNTFHIVTELTYTKLLRRYSCTSISAINFCTKPGR